VKFFKKIRNSPTITTWFSFLTKALNFTIIIPLLLNILTPGDISLWYLYLSLINLLIILDAGFGSTFVRIISYGIVGIIDVGNEFIGQRDNSSGVPNYEYLSETYSIMQRFYGVLSVISFLILLSLGTLIFQNPIEASSNITFAWNTWWWIIISYPILVWGNTYVNALVGTNNIPVLRLWESLFNICSVLTNITIIYYSKSVFLLIISNQLWLLLSVLRNIFLTRKVYVYSRKSPKNQAKELRIKLERMILPSALKSGVGVIMSLGIIQGSGFVLATIVTPAVLAPYLFSLNTIQAIKSFAQAPFYSKLPVFSSLAGSGDIKKLGAIAQRSMRMVYLIYALSFFLLAFGGEYLFITFKSNIEFPNKILWALFGIGFLIERFGAMHLQIFSTTNKIIWHTANGVTGLLMIIFGIVFYRFLGVIAFPLALIAGYCCFYSWYCPMLSYKFLRTNFWKFEKYTFLPFFILTAFFLLAVL
jgi:hypothetical protein